MADRGVNERDSSDRGTPIDCECVPIKFERAGCRRGDLAGDG